MVNSEKKVSTSVRLEEPFLALIEFLARTGPNKRTHVIKRAIVYLATRWVSFEAEVEEKDLLDSLLIKCRTIIENEKKGCKSYLNEGKNEY